MRLGADVLVLGVLGGLIYSLMAMGLVLVYKSARFINLAQDQLGAVSVVILGKLAIDFGVPYWVALPAALLLAVLTGAVVELTVIRRLFHSPRLVLMVASIGLAQLLFALTLLEQLRANPLEVTRAGFPVPRIGIEWNIGAFLFRDADFLTLIVVPAIAVGLAAFLRFSTYGQAIRAAADNPDVARLSGISVKRMSTLVWMIAAVLSAVSGILLAPKAYGLQFGQSSGVLAGLLVRAFAAALFARMTSLPLAFAAGIGVGVIESVALANFDSAGQVELVIFVAVIVALLARAQDLARAGRDAEFTSGFGAEPRPLHRDVAALPGVQLLRGGVVAGALLVALVLPLIPVGGLNSQSKAFGMSLVAGYVIVGLSLCLLTGWGGQVSIGQFALVGVGAFAAARLQGLDIPLVLLIPIVGLIGAGVAVAIGLPAVRIRGLFLAVSTLAFAVLAAGWAFQEEIFVVNPSGVVVSRPDFLRGERAMYYFSLCLAIFFTWVVRNYRNSAPGRLLIAVRDNDRAARSDGISATWVRLIAFMLAGFMASVAGVIFALTQERFNATAFPAATSLAVISMVIVGGLGSIPGAILGAVFLFGSPVLIPRSNALDLMVSGVGLLIFLMYVPGGMISAVYQARDVLIARIVRKEHGLPPLPRILPPLGDLWRAALGRKRSEAGSAQVREPARVGGRS